MPDPKKPPRPRLFIASSVKGKDIADAIHANLDRDAEVTPWYAGHFGLSKTTLADLVRASTTNDFAAFVLHPEDLATIKGQTTLTVRDNVLFEWGLFVGAIGIERCFAVVPRDVPFHLPSDVAGYTPAEYDADRSDDNLEAALNPASAAIRKTIKQLGRLHKADSSSPTPRALPPSPVVTAALAGPAPPPPSAPAPTPKASFNPARSLNDPSAVVNPEASKAAESLAPGWGTTAPNPSVAERLGANPEALAVMDAVVAKSPDPARALLEIASGRATSADILAIYGPNIPASPVLPRAAAAIDRLKASAVTVREMRDQSPTLTRASEEVLDRIRNGEPGEVRGRGNPNGPTAREMLAKLDDLPSVKSGAGFQPSIHSFPQDERPAIQAALAVLGGMPEGTYRLSDFANRANLGPSEVKPAIKAAAKIFRRAIGFAGLGREERFTLEAPAKETSPQVRVPVPPPHSPSTERTEPPARRRVSARDLLPRLTQDQVIEARRGLRTVEFKHEGTFTRFSEATGIPVSHVREAIAEAGDELAREYEFTATTFKRTS